MEIYNIPEHLHGDTFDGLNFEILRNGVAADLTGSQIRIEFRKQKKTGTLGKALTIGAGITITDAVGGLCRMDALRADFGVATFYWDLQVTFADGVQKTPKGGVWPVTQDTTQDPVV